MADNNLDLILERHNGLHGVQTNRMGGVNLSTSCDNCKITKQAIKSESLRIALDLIDSVEIDMEATEKYIRKAMAGKDEDEIVSQISNAQIDYDDRHDALNDVRKALEKGFKQ